MMMVTVTVSERSERKRAAAVGARNKRTVATNEIYVSSSNNVHTHLAPIHTPTVGLNKCKKGGRRWIGEKNVKRTQTGNLNGVRRGNPFVAAAAAAGEHLTNGGV